MTRILFHSTTSLLDHFLDTVFTKVLSLNFKLRFIPVTPKAWGNSYLMMHVLKFVLNIISLSLLFLTFVCQRLVQYEWTYNSYKHIFFEV